MNTPVILDLTKRRYSDAIACEDYELMHQEPMKRMGKIWERLYNEACTKQSKADPDDEETSHDHNREGEHCHNAISVFASRGAGKTTFLLTFLKKIREKKGVVCLEMIDPSLMENKQHPFINVVANIQKVVQEYIDDKECRGPKSASYHKFLNFDAHYKKLLNALPFLDGIGSNAYNDWDDGEYIAEQGMYKAIGSNNLRDLFHKYVESALKLMKKDCFVIPFDDIDTDFKKGFELLEVIRKYLTTNRVIVILSGDIKLYSNLVRKHYWDFFSRDYLHKERFIAGQPGENFAEMIDQLENQYIMKVLKPENQVMLKTLGEYVEMDGIKVKVVTTKDKDSSPSISEYYNDKLINRVIPNLQQNKDLMRTVEHFITHLSMRGQMRILTLLYDLNKEELQDEEDYTKSLSEGLLSIFENDLNQKASNVLSLKKGGGDYTKEMLTFLIHTESLHTRKNFLPESNDEILNKALFAVGAKFNHLIKGQEYLAFDYWLRISYVQALIEQIQGTESSDLSEFLKFTSINTDTGLYKCIGLCQAYCNHRLKLQNQRNRESRQNVMPGTIFVGNNTPLLKGGLSNILSLLPLLGTIDNNLKESVFLSVYKLLVAIRNMLAWRTDEIDYFIISLNKFSQYRSFIEPQTVASNNEQKTNREVDNLSFNILLSEDEHVIWMKLATDFKQWRRKSLDNVSLQLLDKVFTRFYFSLIHISQYYSSNNAAYQLNLHLIALLNATLIENALANGCKGDFYLNNVGDIEQIFMENVQAYKKLSEKEQKGMTLFNWLSTCPMIHWFLRPLIQIMMREKDEFKIKNLTAVLQYDRTITAKERIQKQIDSLAKETEEYERVLNWINDYNALKREEENLNMFERFLNRSSLEMTNRQTDRFTMYLEERTAASKRVAQLRNELSEPMNSSLLSVTLSLKIDGSLIQSEEKKLRSELTEKEKIYNSLSSQGEIIREKWEKSQNGLVESYYLELKKQSEYEVSSSIYQSLSELVEAIK